MEPRIQYAQTKDGVSIAYWTLGKGAPLVVMPTGPWSHIQMEWQLPEPPRWFNALAQKRMLVRYDGRGSGLSERDVAQYSLDALVRDLEAVVDRLGLERFALFAPSLSGPVSVAYAAQRPERVSHLILWCSFPRGSDFYRSPRAQAYRAIRETDWDLYVETVADSALGRRATEEEMRGVAAFVREAVTQEGQQAFMDAAREFDVAAQLPQVRSPTLVLHRRGAPMPEVAVARELASQIPDAQLILLEGAATVPWAGDTEAVLTAIDEFLGEGEEVAAKLPEGMAVLLFADIAESTALTEKLGDSAFRAKARELDTSLRSVIKESGGTPVEGKVLGDGVLAVFTSARQAIECALRGNATGDSVGLRLHLGIHAGDVIREGDNVYGGAVNIAARIAAASEPGEVLVSDTLRGLARTSAGVTFDDRGEHELKGIDEPQRLFAVRGGG